MIMWVKVWDKIGGGILSKFAPLIYLYNAPKLLTDDSPHSNYYCQGDFCQFDKYKPQN
ncbi:MAG: hypothetical protein K0R25_676 [Rickettsiaceae bacterium]|nr:hypothetical protein [Rickettsiaceae bacterium]